MKLEISKEKKELLGQFQLPTYKEIPDVGLYLDQTSKIINQYLEPISDCAITNSMISNYVKHNIIANPIKKQYYRDHIAYLLFISIVKNTLSLENISILFEIQKEEYSLEKAYNYFVDLFKEGLNSELNYKPFVVDDTENINKQLLAGIIKVVVSKILLDERFKSLKDSEDQA